MPANQAKSVTSKRFTGGVEAVLDTPIFFATLSMTSLNSDRLGDRTSMCCFAGSLFVRSAFREQLTTSFTQMSRSEKQVRAGVLFSPLCYIYSISGLKPYTDLNHVKFIFEAVDGFPCLLKNDSIGLRWFHEI